GAPPTRLGGNAAYNPPTASIANTGGHNGSILRLPFPLTLIDPAVTLFISSETSRHAGCVKRVSLPAAISRHLCSFTPNTKSHTIIAAELNSPNTAVMGNVR